MPTFRDSHGKSLADYARPSVAVDTALLTVTPGNELAVLLVGTDAGRRLPGTFLHDGERLADAVLRSLREKAGVEGLAPRQLQVFDDPSRDDRGWVLSVAHLDAVPFDRINEDASLASIVPVTAVEALPFGHNDIIGGAVSVLRADYLTRPDPFGLLKDPFTLRQLRQLHQTIAGHELLRDSFRRAMLPHLRPTDGRNEGEVGKPAQLFTRA